MPCILLIRWLESGNMPLGQWLNAGITGSSNLGVLFMRITRLLQT